MSQLSLYDYLSSLSMAEREVLAEEIGYSHNYLSRLATTKADGSENFARSVYESKFNSKLSVAKTNFTKKALQEFMQAYQLEWQAKRLARAKKARAKAKE